MATSFNLSDLKEALPTTTTKHTKSTVQNKWDCWNRDVIPNHSPNPKQRKITVLYHVTTTDAKTNIIEDKTLRACTAKPLGKLSPSPIDEMKIQGVYFTVNLDKKKDELPKESPYGTERVKIPLAHFREYDIFFNSFHHNMSHGNLIYYLILVLVKQSSASYKKINDILVKLNPGEVVNWNFESNTFEYTDYYKLDQGKSFNVYIEMFVVDDVPVPADATWDKVTPTRRNPNTGEPASP